MDLAPFIVWLALLGFAAASFFFALAETALFSLGKWRVRQLEERADGGGGAVSRLLQEPQDLLATLVLGTTLANSAVVGIALWMSLGAQGLPIGLLLAGTFVLILLGCEVMPKTLAVRAPEFWSLRVAWLLERMVRLTRPLRQIAQRLNEAILRVSIPKSVRPMAAMTDEDCKELIELAFQQGTLAATEREIILQIINLDRRTARDVMCPRSRMAAIPDDLPVPEMLAAARRHHHERLPLFDETPDTMVGILNCRDLLLNPEADLSEVVEFPSFVPQSMNLLELLQSLQRQRRGMAIVLDEFGATAGLVTAEDILEEMIGEIRREGEAQGFVMEKLADGKWRVNGATRLEDFRREHPDLGSVAGVETMGGLLVAQLEMVPEAGESTVFRGLRLTARDVDERRVRELLVERVTARGKGGGT